MVGFIRGGDLSRIFSQKGNKNWHQSEGLLFGRVFLNSAQNFWKWIFLTPKHLLPGLKTLKFAMSYTLIQRQPLADAPEKTKTAWRTEFRCFCLFSFEPVRRRMFLTASSRLGCWLVACTCFWEEVTQQFKNPCEQRLCFFGLGVSFFFLLRLNRLFGGLRKPWSIFCGRSSQNWLLSDRVRVAWVSWSTRRRELPW